MESYRFSDPRSDSAGPEGMIFPGERTASSKFPRPLLFLLAVGALLAADRSHQARAHWIPPQQIVARLGNDVSLRTLFGIREVEQQDRLLIIRVDPKIWAASAPERRRALAEEWYRLWRHNVNQGIVAIVAAGNDEPLVNYDATGQARLLESARSPGGF